MYLWSALGFSHQVIAGGTDYDAVGAGFGPPFTTTGVSGPLALTEPADACKRTATLPAGSVALIEHGSCGVDDKVRRAEAAGAAAVIMANNASGPPLALNGRAKVAIPSLMVSQPDGAALRAQLGTSVTARLKGGSP
jgi:hypothetical protein